MPAENASLQPTHAVLAASALGWIVDCGMDMVVDEAPRHWLTPKPEAVPERRAAPPVTARLEPISQPSPQLGVLLEGLDSLAAIDSALTALDHPLGRRSAARPQLLAVVESAPLLLLAELPLPEGDESRLLAAMLGAIGIRRETCSVAALLPWSTPGSRPARPDEVSDFLPFLQRALALAPQRCILALGQRAGQLAEAGAPLAALRGRALTLNGVTLLTTYAPAMLLRQPALKADAWADLQHLQALLEGHT